MSVICSTPDAHISLDIRYDKICECLWLKSGNEYNLSHPIFCELPRTASSHGNCYLFVAKYVNKAESACMVMAVKFN